MYNYMYMQMHVYVHISVTMYACMYACMYVSKCIFMSLIIWLLIHSCRYDTIQYLYTSTRRCVCITVYDACRQDITKHNTNHISYTYILIYTCIYIHDIHLCIHIYINEGACACIRLVLTWFMISLSAPWLTRYSTISLCPLLAATIIAVYPVWSQEVVDKPYKMAVHQITSMIMQACKERKM